MRPGEKIDLSICTAYAGVMEEGKWSETKTGTPQGSVISPTPANIYLHYVFDLWADVWRAKCAQGEVVVVHII